MPTAPSASTWRAHVRHAKSMGLNSDTAEAYATLMHWGEQLGYQAAPIVSGYRSSAYQRELQARWDRGDRAGMIVRPADESMHSSRDAFDVARVKHLDLYGRLAPFAGLRWGGTFRKRDVVHFDRGAAR